MDPERRADILRRLRCTEGHVRGLARMVETEAEALAVAAQIKAVRRSLDKVALLILQSHLVDCLPAAAQSGAVPGFEQALAELVCVIPGLHTSHAAAPHEPGVNAGPNRDRFPAHPGRRGLRLETEKAS